MSRWLLPAVLVIAGASVGTGMVVRELYLRPAQAKGDPVVQSSTAAQVPGDGSVRLSVDAFAHPDSSRVQTVLQQNFDAINALDFARWRGTVTNARAQQTVERGWRDNYATTRDGGIVVQRIDSDAVRGRLRVLMNFVSTQDPAKAPKELPVGCIRWRVVYVMTWEAGDLRLDVGPENRAPQMSEC